MIKLLTVYEQEKLRTSENLKSFFGKYSKLLNKMHLFINHVHIIVCQEFNDVSQLNTYTKEMWTTAVEKFEQKLQPAEDLIAGKLRNLINRKKSNTVEVRNNMGFFCLSNQYTIDQKKKKSFQQLIHEFIRYQEIIERPKIYVQLKGELENFLNCLKKIISVMGDVDEEYAQKMNVLELAGLEPIVRNIYSLKQQEAKVVLTSTRILNNFISIIFAVTFN